MRVMLSEQRQMPKMSDLKVTNLMNREAIQQVRLLGSVMQVPDLTA